MQIIWQPGALDDLESLRTYIARFNPQAANTSPYTTMVRHRRVRSPIALWSAHVTFKDLTLVCEECHREITQ
jgi:hypothetical protein